MRSTIKKSTSKASPLTTRHVNYCCDNSLACGTTQVVTNSQRWNIDESILFYRCYMDFGRDWQKISKIIQTRSMVQVVSHSQKIQKSLSQAVYNTIQENRIKLEAEQDANLQIKTRRNCRNVFSQIKIEEIISDPNNKELIHQEILKRLGDLEAKKNSQKSIDNFHLLNAQTWAGCEEDLPSKDDLGPFQSNLLVPGSLHLAFFPYFASYYSPYSFHNIATISPIVDYTTPDLMIKQQYTGDQANSFPLIQFNERNEIIQYGNKSMGMNGDLVNQHQLTIKEKQGKKMEKKIKCVGKNKQKDQP